MEMMEKDENKQTPLELREKATPVVTNEKKTSPESSKSEAWHCLGPLGERPGPFIPGLLKLWNELNQGAKRYKVWRVGHTPEEAIPLAEALAQLFPDEY